MTSFSNTYFQGTAIIFRRALYTYLSVCNILELTVAEATRRPGLPDFPLNITYDLKQNHLSHWIRPPLDRL